MKDGKPTVDEIKELIPKLRDEVYGKLHEEFEQDNKFYELDFQKDLDIPTEFKSQGIVLPTARDMVDTFVDHIDIGNARVFVNRKGTSNLSMEEAEMMRKFYLGILHRTNVEADISPWRVLSKHYSLHGLGVMKTVYDADRWGDRPEKKDNESDVEYAERMDEWRSDTHDSLPIVIQSVNPKCIYPDPSYGGRMFIIEEQSRVCFDAMKRWPHWGNPKNKKLDEEVTFAQYWDKDFRCDLVDDEPILKIRGGVAPHGYGFIPYVLIDSGLGNVSFENEPEKRYVGILRYMFNLLVSESRDFSIADVVLSKAAWPVMFAEGDNTAAMSDVEMKYGTINRLPPGVTLKEYQQAVPPEALNQHLARTSDYIAAHAAPRSVRGLGEVGVRSGADRRLVIAEASSRYQYSTEAFKYGAAKVLINCARLMKNVVPGDIRVWARTPCDEFDVEIKKDKMKEPFTCYVEFAPVSEEDEYRRHDDLERLVASGIVTRRWARTQMSNVDAMALEVDEERERLKNDPNVQQIVSQYLAGRLAQALSKRAMAEGLAEGLPIQNPAQPPAQQGGTSGVPRQMNPPIPNVPPLGSAGNLQNQMKANRSQAPMNPMQGFGGGGNR